MLNKSKVEKRLQIICLE